MMTQQVREAVAILGDREQTVAQHDAALETVLALVPKLLDELDSRHSDRSRDPHRVVTPKLKEFAERWLNLPVQVAVEGEVLSRREVLARHYGVSRSTISGWTRQARDLGMIPPARTGRPRRS